MEYPAFKKIHKYSVNTYEASIYSALQGQIEAFITEYQKNPHARPWHLPTSRLETVLTKLYGYAGGSYAKVTAVDLRRQGVSFPARYKMKEYLSARELKHIGLRPWKFIERKDDPTAEELYIQFIQEYLRLHLLSRSVIPITETTKAFILRVISEGVAAGWGIDKIVRELRNSDLTKYRAQLIARTETTRAMNTGAMMAAAAGNVAVRKKWVSAQDNRTRRLPKDEFDHLHMNGVIAEYDEPFIIESKGGGEELQFPGDPTGSAGDVINCRCTQVFVPIRDESGELIDPLTYNSKLVNNDFYQIVNKTQ
jgi:hypothetical protein